MPSSIATSVIRNIEKALEQPAYLAFRDLKTLVCQVLEAGTRAAALDISRIREAAPRPIADRVCGAKVLRRRAWVAAAGA